MSEGRPDTTGYTLDRARALLEEAGVRVGDEVRVGPAPEQCEGGRSFVIRQRDRCGGTVELTVAGEWRCPTARGE